MSMRVEKWKKPSVLGAKTFALQARVQTPAGKPVPLFRNIGRKHWASDFGPGIVLYFEFLKFFSLLFFLMFLIGLPLTVFSLLGDGLPINKDSLFVERTTLGNLLSNVTTSGGSGELNESIQLPGNYSFSKKHLAWLLPALDIVAVIMFLIAVKLFKRRMAKTVTAIDDAALTAGDYGIVVKGMPKNATEREIRKIFELSDFGRVTRCDLAIYTHGFLTLADRRGELEQKIEIAYGHIAKITAEETDKGKPDPFRIINGKLASDEFGNAADHVNALEEQLERLKRQQLDKTNNEVYAAFLIYEKELQKNAVLRRYHSNRPRLAGKKLRVAEAPEPTDVAWENLEYSPQSRILRRTLTGFLSAVLVAISFGFIYFAKTWTQNQSAFSSDCTPLYDSYTCPNVEAAVLATPQLPKEDVLLSMMSTIETISVGNETRLDLCTTCFCRTSATKYPSVILSSSPLRSFCQTVISQISLRYLLIFLSIIAVVLINLALKFMLSVAVKFERRHTLSEIQRSIASKIFIAQFVNTAIITLLVNAKIPTVRDYFKKIGASFPVFDGQFSDLESEWYAIVGASLIVTMCLNALLVCIPLVVEIPLQWIKELVGRRTAVTQNELNEIYAGPRFELAERVGVLLNALFVCTLYSAPAPIFHLIASITFFLAYWVDKITILRLYRAPPMFNDELAKLSVRLMPWGMVGHLMIGLWAFPAILPRQALTPQIQAYIDTFTSRSGIRLDARLINWAAFPSFVFCIGLLLYLGWDRFLRFVLRKLYACMTNTRAALQLQADTDPQYSRAITMVRWKGPRTYDVRELPRYAACFSNLAQRARRASVAGKQETITTADGTAIEMNPMGPSSPATMPSSATVSPSNGSLPPTLTSPSASLQFMSPTNGGGGGGGYGTHPGTTGGGQGTTNAQYQQPQQQQYQQQQQQYQQQQYQQQHQQQQQPQFGLVGNGYGTQQQQQPQYQQQQQYSLPPPPLQQQQMPSQPAYGTQGQFSLPSPGGGGGGIGFNPAPIPPPPQAYGVTAPVIPTTSNGSYGTHPVAANASLYPPGAQGGGGGGVWPGQQQQQQQQQVVYGGGGAGGDGGAGGWQQGTAMQAMLMNGANRIQVNGTGYVIAPAARMYGVGGGDTAAC